MRFKDSHQRICISSTFTSRTGSQQGSKRSCNFVISYPSFENSIVGTTSLVWKPLLLTSLPDFLLSPDREKHYLVENETPDMDHIRKELHEEGISEESVFLITNARRSSTNCYYKSAWHKWGSWCTGRQIDLVNDPLTNF